VASKDVRSQLIVIIDDDAPVCQALQRLLKSLGYAVASYGTAVDFLRSQSFAETALLILDVQMPGMSGLDLQNVITPLRTPIPIIFITAHPEEDIRSRAIQSGAVGFLEKPFDEQLLIALLDKVLRPQNTPQ
jgi:FixJ family two-component response regulator